MTREDVVRLVAGLLVLAIGFACGAPASTAPARANSFRELHSETWGITWRLYVLQHASGACFVAMEPSGEGGGAIVQADPVVCAYELRTER